MRPTAVGTLFRWYRSGIDPNTRLIHPATFLGHADPASTAVYLTITEELLREADRRFRVFAPRGRPIMSTIGQVLFSFFEDHIKVQKGLRPGSIKSYRDTIKLFLAFTARTCRKPVTRLSLTDLSSQRVLDFLQMIEVQRHNKPQTRNQRLAALHTFYRFVATHHCEMLAEAERVEAIPNKRTSPAPTQYLDHDEIDRLFQMLASRGGRALRDQALLMLLYNTGARVQEVANLR